ncbi:2-oxo-4-hydroxy-4-carboxy-5-ureidoimidazoline decarboxylase [Oerskovia flava]|uniref:2-oxo-4-hydroxy-4-carboxy-5-ureidoimidazoline decarboxylase n=1 Tax=Oerskovia flava TaxID=2986422 RepID=UPI0022405631|nr:2-oxo-4-hydroxy-4-carboxy-5-ureidoimidazoline decarboxylase [Oerskovia sp. JB1-3-2]
MEDHRTSLAAFNAAPAAAARPLLLACVPVERWADEILAGRPYADRSAVLAVAERAAEPWSRAEIDRALAAHPRIGERPVAPGAEAALSRSEQSGVDPDDADVARRLAEGNRAYEERFGYVFLVRAAGRDAHEILAALDERLGHAPHEEIQVAARNLREIAVLRLERMLDA